MQIYYTLKAMNIWSRGQVVKTPPFHGGIRGSSPLEITNRQCLFFLFCLIKVKKGTRTGGNSKGNCVCVCPPRHDSRLPAKNYQTAEWVPSRSPKKKLHFCSFLSKLKKRRFDACFCYRKPRVLPVNFCFLIILCDY